ncbi:elongator complex protein 5 [Varanus komodoensis]|uniref:elongator complex protein 5 n=1 Tax=Varanus komodoensis TaxID=61221 RepID=UPI001CF7B9EB|nr:elongator complex protein 5 [Varanus komodoensis]
MLAELAAGRAEGLVLLQDSVRCEGRTLLKSFAAASAQRGESVHVLSFEVPEKEFKAGFGPEVASWIWFHDAFRDPLGWAGEDGCLTVEDFSAPGLASRLALASQGPATVLLDSLSWLLLRLPFPGVCRVLAQLPRSASAAGLQVNALVALLHGDLHQPGELAALRALAHVAVAVEPAPGTVPGGDGAPRVAETLHRKRGGKVARKKEYITLLPGFILKHLGEPRPDGFSREGGLEDDEAPARADPTANLTFNLRLSEAERRAKESVPLPYHFSEEKKSSLLRTPSSQGTIFYEPDASDDIDDEDPDDDLDV